MEELKDLAKAVLSNKELLKLIYTDLAQPGTRQVGKALETVLGLGNTVLLPARLLNEKASHVFRVNMEKYREAIKGIPEEEVQEVAPEIGVPIVDRLTYVSDEALSDMFVKLLARASSTNHADEAHPAFVSIIDNLCPDEALLIRAVSTLAINKYGEFAFKATGAGYVRPGYEGVVYEKQSLLLDPHILNKVNLQYPEYVPAYIQNLARLGLVDIGQFMPQDEPEEINLRIREHYKDKPKQSPSYGLKGMGVLWFFGEVRYTEFGRFFKHSCMSDA